MWKKTSVVLALILVLAFIVRIIFLDLYPIGFFCDEASIGYDAYSILTTGKDQHGKVFPLFFRSLDDYKNPVFIYSAIPFIWIFGLSEFSVRLTSVMYGLGTIFFLFLLIRKLFNDQMALWSSFFLAVSPWHIHFSRIGFELISSGFWVLVSIYALYKTLKDLRYYPLAVVCLIMAFFSYTSPKLYLIPFIIAFFCIHYKQTFVWVKKPLFWLTTIIAVITMLISLKPYLDDSTFFARWEQVKSPQLDIRFLINAYLNHFSLDFLFRKGDIDFPEQFISRHSIRGIGQLYWLQLPFILLAFKRFFLIPHKKNMVVFILLLLVYPLGSIFTGSNPQATRSFIGVIPFQVLTAIGIVELYKIVKHKYAKHAVTIVLSIAFLVSFIHYGQAIKTYHLYSADFWGWQYGPKPIMNYFLSVQDQYDDMYMQGVFNNGEIFPPFYSQGSCRKCTTGDFDRYDAQRKQLFAIEPKRLTEIPSPFSFVIKHHIYYPDGTLAFVIGELKNKGND